MPHLVSADSCDWVWNRSPNRFLPTNRVGSGAAVTVVDPLRTSYAVDVTRTASFAVVRPKGLLDRAACQPLEDALLALDTEPLVLLDLSEVSQLDAAGVAMLLRLRQQGVALRCIDPSLAAESVLRATGASMVLGLSPG